MKKTLDFFKAEFPNDVTNIRDSIDFLDQCLDNVCQSIQEKAAMAVVNRESERVSIMMDCLQRIDELKNKLGGYSSLLDLDDSFSIEFTGKKNGKAELTKIPNYDEFLVDSTVSHTLTEDYTHKRPAAFSLKGKNAEATEWKHIFVKTCQELVDIDREVFENFIFDKTIQGKKVSYFSKNSSSVRKAESVQGTDIYVTTNLSANQIRNIIQKMLLKYRIPQSDYKIYLRADYTPLHE